MLLLHTVLAVVCGGMFVSAHPEPVRGRDWYSGDTEFTDANVPSYHVQHSAPADSDEPWGWAPQGPQQVLDTPPHHAEGFAFPGADPKTWPKPPHSVPGPPQDGPEPPQFPPEPHYPPPPPGRPGPPGPPPPPPPPPKDGPPHFPHPPHFPKPGDNTKEQTVYQFLEGHPKFSRLFKLVNYTEDITNLLNDSAQSVTFFALPDFGFPKPPHRRASSHEDFEFEDLLQMREGSVGDMLATAEGYLNSVRKPDEKKIKAFLKYVLLYNILPENTPLQELGKNNTFATALKLRDGSLDGEPLRIHVKKSFFLDPRPSVNFFSKVLIPNIPVKNGVIHVVNKPILPPPSIFQIGFLLQNVFSTFTSALQRVGLTDELDFRNVERGSVQGEPAVSVFAPTNKAFAKLPPKLKLFLFSPFGEKALKKLLQFHIVPKAVVHSDYFHNASSSESALPRDSSETSEFFSNIGHHLEEWSTIAEEHFDDEDSYENNAWREENSNLGGPSWENGYQYGYDSSPSGEPFRHEGLHEGPHFPNPGDAPQHHGPFPSPPPPPTQGGPHPPPHFPPPPEVWVHYPPPPPPSPPPHYVQNRPDHPPPPPPDVWVHYPPPPPPPHGPHHPPHFPAPPPPPPPFEDWPNHTPPPPRGPAHAPHFPSPPPPPHSPHHVPHFPPPPPFESWPHHAPPPPPHRGPHHAPPPPPSEHWPHHPPPPSRPPSGPHPPSHPPGKVPKGSPRHKVIFSVNTTVPTLLENFPLHLKVVQVAFKGPLPKKPFFAGYHTIVIAHGQPVAVADVAARNGAIHVITKLLNPFKKPGDHHKHEEEGEEPAFGPFAEDSEDDEWAGWEEWLLRWAEED